MLPQGFSFLYFFFPKLTSSFHPGLPGSAFGPHLVSTSPFPPEEEVFSISIERERRGGPILWHLDDAVGEKMKEDGSVFAFPNSPPPEQPVDNTIAVKGPATPPPMVFNVFSFWLILP